MNKLPFLLLLLLAGTFSSKADTLQVIFRLYDANGKVVSGENTRVLSENAQMTRLFSEKGEAWQHWQLVSDEALSNLAFIAFNDTLHLSIDVYSEFRNKRARTVVLNRLQNRGKKEVVKINHITCRWQGTIAYPLEYTYMNPLDGTKLQLQATTGTLLLPEGMTVEVDVLSDSVMLFACGDKQALFVKYFLRSDGTILLQPTNAQCTGFNSEAQRTLYTYFLHYQGTVFYHINNNEFTMRAGDKYALFSILGG